MASLDACWRPSHTGCVPSQLPFAVRRSRWRAAPWGPQAPPVTASPTPVISAGTTRFHCRGSRRRFWTDSYRSRIGQDDIAGRGRLRRQGGHVLFEKGYGYADVAAKRRVSPDSTLFRPGSISSSSHGQP